MFELLKALILLSFLSYASYSDLKSRTVSNFVIVIAFSVLVPFIVMDTFKNPYSLLFMVIGATLAYLMYHLKFGGADVKIVLLLSLSYPFEYIIFMVNATLIAVLSMVIASGIYRKNYLIAKVKLPFVPFILIGVLYGLFFGAII